MCEPATIAIASTVAGGVMSYAQQKQEGRNAASVANFNAQTARINAQNSAAEANYRAAIERNNAQRAQYLAEDSIARGRESESQERLRGRLLIGQMRATLASNGVLVDEDSAGDLVIDQAQTNETNAQTVRNNAAREAQEFRIQAEQFNSQGELLTRSGQNIRASGERDAAGLERNGAIARSEANSAATGSLLTTAGSVANKWYTFKNAGAWGSTSAAPSTGPTGEYGAGVWGR